MVRWRGRWRFGKRITGNWVRCQILYLLNLQRTLLGAPGPQNRPLSAKRLSKSNSSKTLPRCRSTTSTPPNRRRPTTRPQGHLMCQIRCRGRRGGVNNLRGASMPSSRWMKQLSSCVSSLFNRPYRETRSRRIS